MRVKKRKVKVNKNPTPVRKWSVEDEKGEDEWKEETTVKPVIVILMLDLWLAKDNRFLNPKSSYERILLAPPCRLINVVFLLASVFFSSMGISISSLLSLFFLLL